MPFKQQYQIPAGFHPDANAARVFSIDFDCRSGQMFGMKENRLLKFSAVLLATIAALLMAELVVRLVTIYPNTLASNRVFDEDLGFRASAKIAEVDAFGFRNPEGRGREILAIGDSHTFGFNVRSDGSWPSRLGQMIGKNVYNLGSGGYGLLTYHSLLMQQRRPETKAALVGLFAANDFELFYASDADCLILAKPSRFWTAEQQRLALNWPAFPVGCLHNDYDTQRSLFDRARMQSALLALSSDVVIRLAEFLGRESQVKFPSWTTQSQPLTFPDGIYPITVNRIQKHTRSVDLNVPEVAAMWRNLPRFLKAWQELSAQGVQVGIMVIPSRERVIYEYFVRQNRLGEMDRRFVEGVQNQVALETKLREVLEESGIDFVFAIEDMHRAHLYGRNQNIAIYPPTDDGHPLALGYAAYAGAAKRLVDRMGLD
jgi:lysophospholipase L1-like esterase